MDELVSIVVAVYNGEKYLQPQVQSLQSQGYQNLEIILADDCSKDGSWQMAQALSAKDPRIKLLRNPQNLGITGNFLKGLLLAQGQFICLCDQDDVWRSDKVALLKQLLESSPQNMLAYSDLEVCDEGLRTIRPSFWRTAGIRPRAGYLKEKAFLRNLTPGCSMMFRREVRESMSRFSDSMPFMHDHLAWILSAALGRVVFSREKLVKYRQHDQNNIGVSERPPVSKQFRAQRLQEQIDYFRQKDLKSPLLDLQRLERFVRASVKQGGAPRAEFLPYYLFLRKDAFPDKLFGAVEWLKNGRAS